MKVLVAVKRVIDPYVNVRVKPDQTGVETTNVKMAMNPFDEIAVEQAIQFKEQGLATDVVVVTIGGAQSQETLRQALALGADRAIHVTTEQSIEPLAIAKVLKQVVEQGQAQLVVMGKQSIDGDNNQTPQMLAALLGWPQGTYAYKTTLGQESIEVVREVDGGLETLNLTLPAVVSTDLRLNQPRFASLPNIMKAKKKPLDVIELASMSIDVNPRIRSVKVTPPPTRAAGVKVDSVDALVDKLHNEAKVI